jgi:HSP20 family molecular chaperone IbpA
MERVLDRVAKTAGDGYPPYNIEQTGESALRITLAVAGFTEDDLSVSVEDNQLIVRGQQSETGERTYLHRGIAARQFQRGFVLAEGLEVVGAALEHGLLHIDLVRPQPKSTTARTVKIMTPAEAEPQPKRHTKHQDGAPRREAAELATGERG